MPVYTYQCEECGERFEAKQSFSDAPLTICPTCEGKIHRVIQPVGIVFKGSGFYVTDSRGKQNLATNGSKKDESKSTESTGSSGSDGGGENGGSSTSSEKSAPAAAESSASTKSETSAKPSTSSSPSE